MINQNKNLEIALREADNTEKSLSVQEKELEIRRQQMIIDNEERRTTTQTFHKLLDKFIDKSESSQDVFIRLKSDLDLPITL